jgi:shikimate kinase
VFGPQLTVRALALIGLPGSGKSTIGKALARRLSRSLVDSDAVIEARIGQPVRAFFEEHGEERFRDVECQVIDELTLLPDVVLATGGGAVLRDENRRNLRERCQVVYLRSTPDDLYRRLRHDKQRPLLQVLDPLAKLRELFERRDPLYREVASFSFDTGGATVSTVVNRLLMQLELAGSISQDRVDTPPAGPPFGH